MSQKTNDSVFTKHDHSFPNWRVPKGTDIHYQLPTRHYQLPVMWDPCPLCEAEPHITGPGPMGPGPQPTHFPAQPPTTRRWPSAQGLSVFTYMAKLHI